MINPWSFPPKDSIKLPQFESVINVAIPSDIERELHNALTNKKSIGIACSGGADSVFLTFFLFYHFRSLRKNLYLLHFNHLLRGEESELDEKFVSELANYLNLPCHCGKDSAHKKNDEGSLRNRRLDFFHKTADKLNLSILAQGHHADDVAETMLWRLPRSSTVSGLISPKPVALNNELLLIRPLINHSRQDIRRFLKKINFPWREDDSNSTPKYLRNRIRSNVLPRWKESVDRDLIKGISKTRRLLQQDDEALWYYSKIAYNQCSVGNSIKIHKFNDYPLAVRRRVFRLWVKDYFLGDINFEGKESELLAQIQQGNINTPDINQNLKIEIKNSLLSFCKIKEKYKILPHILLPLNQRLFLPNTRSVSATQVALDVTLEKISIKSVEQSKEAFISSEDTTFQIRSKRQGDRFQQLGSKGSKKVSKIMTNAKWSKQRKSETPVFVDETNQIIWIPGFAPAENFKVTTVTKRVIHLTYD